MANSRGRKGKERKNSTSLPDSDRGGSRVHIQDRKGRNTFRRLKYWEMGKSGKWKRSQRLFHHFEGFKSHRFKMGWIIMVGFNRPKAQNSSYSAILTVSWLKPLTWKWHIAMVMKDIASNMIITLQDSKPYIQYLYNLNCRTYCVFNGILVSASILRHQLPSHCIYIVLIRIFGIDRYWIF